MQDIQVTLVPLFEATLRYTSTAAADAVVSPAGRDGELIGSGDGTVCGQRLQGRIRWSFYAAECAYLLTRDGREVPPGRHMCHANPAGTIETEDGAAIRFDARGYGLRGFDPKEPERWRLAMALQFQTDDERYRWLNDQFGVWEGQFDEKTRTARYRAFFPTLEETPIIAKYEDRQSARREGFRREE